MSGGSGVGRLELGDSRCPLDWHRKQRPRHKLKCHGWHAGGGLCPARLSEISESASSCCGCELLLWKEDEDSVGSVHSEMQWALPCLVQMRTFREMSVLVEVHTLRLVYRFFFTWRVCIMKIHVKDHANHALNAEKSTWMGCCDVRVKCYHFPIWLKNVFRVK